MPRSSSRAGFGGNRIFTVPAGARVRCPRCGELATEIEACPVGSAAVFLLAPCGDTVTRVFLEDLGEPVIDVTYRER